jgi:hypothetical protein
MLAPKIATPKTKAAGSPVGTLASQRFALAEHRFGQDSVQQTHFLRGASWDFSKIAVFPHDRSMSPQPTFVRTAASIPRTIQAKLVVGRGDDPLEWEADAVANRIMGTAEPVAQMPAAPGRLSRSCAACEATGRETVNRKRIEPDDEVHGKLRGSPPTMTADLERRVREIGSGKPLPAASRAFFEPRFGYDFSRVRVHDNPAETALASRLNARAFTHGPNIVFGAGQFAPETHEGQHLLAHELAHVVQQGQAAPGLVQRDLATPPTATTPAAQPDLTPAQIAAAIRSNRQRYDKARTEEIQNLIGTTPTGTWVDEDIRVVAALQEEFGLHKDGLVGPDTFQFLDLETGMERQSVASVGCLHSFQVNVDAPTVGPVAGGHRTISGHHSVRAQFPQSCGCGEYDYRQFIRGHWNRIRGGVTQDLANTFNTEPVGRLPAAFTEDGNNTTPALNYGHRGQANERANNGFFDDPAGATANQAGGCHYLADDTPGGPDAVMAGDVFDVLVAFRGEIRRGGNVVETKFWNDISGRFPVP